MTLAAYRLGLTGGIGSGKSTVASMLAQMGAHVIDADAISRTTTAKNGAAVPALKACFGSSIVTADGALDRDKMRALVFTDSKAKVLLEGIVHPLVNQAIGTQARQAQADGAACIVFDIPLLVESAHWRQSLQRVLVIDCTPPTQVTRVMARNSLSTQDVQQIVAAQAPRAVRLQAADMVLFNDSISLEELQRQVRKISTQFGL